MADSDIKNIEEPEILNDDPEVRGIEKKSMARKAPEDFL